MPVWTCTIYGQPIGKGRPRFNPQTKRAHTPEKTRSWEASAAWELRWGGPTLRAPLTCPVELHITALFQRPKRLLHRPLGTLAKSKPMVREMHCATPDADNVVKAVSDALEKAGIVRNDSQIWRVSAEKWYCDPDEEARVLVRLEWI